jgi:hypothetical protein
MSASATEKAVEAAVILEEDDEFEEFPASGTGLR